MRIAFITAFVLAGFIGSQAQANILPSPNISSSAKLAERAKVVCGENGFCVRAPTRRPVAKWVYGDTNSKDLMSDRVTTGRLPIDIGLGPSTGGS
jgi:hypothetical protein